MDYAALLGLLGQTGMSLLGEAIASGDKAAQRKILQGALAKIQGIEQPNLPTVEADQLGASEAGAVSADPALQSAQMNALSKLKQIEDMGGLTLEDQAAQKQIMDRVAQQEAAQRNQISNQMQARGTGGSGAELAMQLQNQQGAAERGNEAGLNTAAQAQKRYYDSIMGRGQLAGQIRSQGFGEQMQAAQARDAMARYNQASREKAKYYNAGLPQQAYQNKMGQAQLYLQGAQPVAGNYGQGARDTQGLYSGLGVGAFEAARPYAERDAKGTDYSQEYWKRKLKDEYPGYGAPSGY